MTNRVLRRTLLVLGAVAVLLMIVFGPQLLNRIKAKTNPPALATASLNSFPVVAKASGTLFPQSLMYVNFATAGSVAELDVKVGDTVTASQQLAKLDQNNAQSALFTANAAVAAATSQLNAAYASGNAASIASAKAQLANADQQQQLRQADLANTVLTAPEAANVLQINVQVGETVTPGVTKVPALAGSSNAIIDPNQTTPTNGVSAEIVLGSATTYQVSAAFSEADASQLVGGQTGQVNFDAVPGLALPGHVTAIASSATLVNGVPEYYAAVAVVGTDQRLRSGMNVNVNVDVAQANNVLTVPNQAIYTLNGAQYVNVWFQGKGNATQVTTGLVGDKLTQITSGLVQGQQVVLTAASTLPTPSASP